jgi:hypothetical protein
MDHVEKDNEDDDYKENTWDGNDNDNDNEEVLGEANGIPEDKNSCWVHLLASVI